jgi:hypothetical protein
VFHTLLLPILKLLINISVFVFLPFWASAQVDSLLQTDKKNKYLPTGLRISTDALSIARNFYDDTFSGWEVNADVDLNRFYFTVDYGNWSRTFDADSNDYSNDGRYFRIGADVNFLTKDPERNMFFLGLRYGRSVFSEELILIDSDDLWGIKTETYTNNNVHASWFELTTGIKVKIYRAIWMGYTVRFKLGLSTGDTPNMLPHDIPGYGRTDKESYWGFNYQIMFRIPVRKQPPFIPPKKK